MTKHLDIIVANRPLSHIRVLDFGQYLAGPMVGMMLADLGAEVIRIDPPEGPRWRDPAFDMLSRGKRSLALDLKSDSGRQTALDLVARSDVVIENFRPGVMQRLGLGPQSLGSVNPGIVTLSLPGFASTDPELAGLAAWEATIAARTGQFTDMGLNRRLMGINPSFTPLGLASAYGAAFGAMSVLFALGSRHRNGGEHVEVPLASALFEGLAYNCEQIENYPQRYKSPREIELERRAACNQQNDLGYEDLQAFLDPFYRTYRCADGRGFYIVSCSITTHPRRVLSVLGLDDLAATLPDFDAYLDRADWPDEWALRNYPVGDRDRARVAVAMQSAFLKRPSWEWEELFGIAKAPATAQRSTREWLSDTHALDSGLVLTLTDPRYGEMRQMGNLAWLYSDSEACTKSPGPELDDLRPDLPRLLAEEPRPTVEVDGSSGWLEDLIVVDLSNVIAGPTIGSTLARFGAQVTSVQPVTPSVDPWNAVVFGLQAHRGKESVLLNLRDKEGKEALKRLITEADVVTLNGSDAQRDALGFSPQQMLDLNPRLILVQLDAFGGPRRGLKSDHLGYDDLAQAATGVMVRFGGSPDTPEEHAHFGTIDALTGYVACVALAAALERRNRSGVGGIARTSLAACGEMIQAQFMYDFEDRPAFDEPAGRDVTGWGPFYHCYRAADQWMFFAAPSDRFAVLSHVPELADLADADEDCLTTILAQRFICQPASHWMHRMNRSSASVVPLGSLAANREAGLQVESKEEIDIDKATYRTIRHDRHLMERWVDLVAPNAIRCEKAAIRIPADAPKYGQHTRSVLKRTGYSEKQINNMIATDAAGEAWSNKYLPE